MCIDGEYGQDHQALSSAGGATYYSAKTQGRQGIGNGKRGQICRIRELAAEASCCNYHQARLNERKLVCAGKVDVRQSWHDVAEQLNPILAHTAVGLKRGSSIRPISDEYFPHILFLGSEFN
jgi:hypothetical protein